MIMAMGEGIIRILNYKRKIRPHKPPHEVCYNLLCIFALGGP